MQSPVLYERRGDVALITLDKPPVNGLGAALRKSLLDALDRAEGDPQVRAVVLTGSARAFSAGGDVTEFGTPKAVQNPRVRYVIECIENASKPVVAAIAGQCLGGGFELALGCHYRVAAADATVGLPEVRLGLLPGAGGTQRLPRLLGLEAALNMIVSGRTGPASALQDTPLFDRITTGDVIEEALAFARSVAHKRPIPRVRDIALKELDGDAYLQFARDAIRKSAGRLPAPLQCLEAVAQVVGSSFDEGMRVENELFNTLMASPESRALRHIFTAERAATKVPGLAQDTTVRSIATVAVLGAGTMGAGIAMTFANAGIPVCLLDTTQAALDRGLATIARNYAASVKKGKLASAQADARTALIRPTLDFQDLAAVDLVIEAVFEEMNAKQAVFERLDAVAKPGAILATNTSTLDVDRIAAFTRRPQDVLGLHFFSPAHVMRLLEIVRGAQTSDEVLATALALAKRIGKTAVVAGVCDGFIGNRMSARYFLAANDLLLRGASPRQIDTALERFGFAMGLLRMADMAGLDVGWAVRKRRKAAQAEAYMPMVADRICEAGRFGQKTNAGWYRYESGQREPLPDPAVDEIIAGFRADFGVSAREIAEPEIIERCMFALINEGARLLDEGIALRASDIDVVYLNGFGFPRHLGGPMLYADRVGLSNIARRLRQFASEPGAHPMWQPAPLLVRLAEEDKTFH